MAACIKTIFLNGLEAFLQEVHVEISVGLSAFRIVGLSEKAGKELWARICTAFQSMGLSFPRDDVRVSLAPIGKQKEGDHYDLPIALGILGAYEVLPLDELSEYCAVGKLDLKGNLKFVAGVFPAALEAHSRGLGLICPEISGSEAAWAAEDFKLLASNSLLTLINHFKGTQVLRRPEAKFLPKRSSSLDLKDICGHETLKRVLEIALAGGHSLWIKGLPSAECLQIAACIEGLLSPLSPSEALEVNMIYSVAGLLRDGGLSSIRPFRYLKGGTSFTSRKIEQVGFLQEILSAHHGVLFLEEMSKFSDSFFEAVYESLKIGKVRCAEEVYPAQIQLICVSDDPSYLVKTRFLDYMDLSLEASKISSQSFLEKRKEESSEFIQRRIIKAQEAQQCRYERHPSFHHIKKNSGMRGERLEEACKVSLGAQDLLKKAGEKFKFSESSVHKTIRVARTIADLDASLDIEKHHMGEALNYRPFLF